MRTSSGQGLRVGRMVQVRPPPGIDVRHQVEHAMPLHHALAGQHSNVMSGLERHRGIDFEMCIDHDHFAHFAGADVVHGRDARRLDQLSPDGLDLLFVNGPVHQIMHRIPCKAHPLLVTMKPTMSATIGSMLAGSPGNALKLCCLAEGFVNCGPAGQLDVSFRKLFRRSTVPARPGCRR